MEKSKITVQANISVPLEKVWQYYTQPEHIVKWNFADPSWHYPAAENDMQVGGTYKARIEAKDGSNGFDFKAVYTKIKEFENFSYEFIKCIFLRSPYFIMDTYAYSKCWC